MLPSHHSSRVDNRNIPLGMFLKTTRCGVVCEYAIIPVQFQNGHIIEVMGTFSAQSIISAFYETSKTKNNRFISRAFRTGYSLFV